MKKKLLLSLIYGLLVLASAGCASNPQLFSSVPDLFHAGKGTDSSDFIELNANSSLNDILAYGAVSNPGLKAAFHMWRAAEERIPFAGALPDPQFSFTYFLREIETKVGPQQGKISFSQMIPSGGKLGAKERVASFDAEIFRAKYEKVKAMLYHKIRSAYSGYYLNTQMLRISLENLNRLQTLKPVIEAAYKTGKTPYGNYIRIQIGIDKEDEKAASFKDSLENSIAKLNSLLSRSLTSSLPGPILADIHYTAITDLSEEELFSLLRRSNPDLRVLRTRITKAEAGVDLADRMDSPNFMVGGSWMITGGTAMPVEDAGKDPVALMFGLSIPIYREKYRSIENSSRQMHRSLIKAFHDKENSVRSDAQILLRDINSFNRKVELFNTRLISKARQAYEVTRSAFQTGTANFADLLEGVRLLLDLEGSMEKASVQKAKHISKLLLLFGNTLTFSQKQ